MAHIRKFSLMLMLLALFWGPSMGQDEPGDPGTYRAGEKSFQELVNADGSSCVECHYFSEQDTINWNPSAMDLAGRVGIYKAEGIGLYFSDPEGEVLKKAHEGVSLSGEQQSELISYLVFLQANPFIPSAPLKGKMILFIGMFVFLILLRLEKKLLRKLPKIVRRIVGARYTHSERVSGTFRRTVPLPRQVEEEGITASMEEGILRLELPKKGTGS